MESKEMESINHSFPTTKFQLQRFKVHGFALWRFRKNCSGVWNFLKKKTLILAEFLKIFRKFLEEKILGKFLKILKILEKLQKMLKMFC